MEEKPIIQDLADATEITERQKMAIWLSCQILVGNMTKEQALEEARRFCDYMDTGNLSGV